MSSKKRGVLLIKIKSATISQKIVPFFAYAYENKYSKFSLNTFGGN